MAMLVAMVRNYTWDSPVGFKLVHLQDFDSIAFAIRMKFEKLGA